VNQSLCAGASIGPATTFLSGVGDVNRAFLAGVVLTLVVIGVGQKLYTTEPVESVPVAAMERPEPVVVTKYVKSPVSVVTTPPELHADEDENVNNEDVNRDREKLARLAESIIPNGRAWQAKHGDEISREQAKMLLAKMDRYDARIGVEHRSEAKTSALIKQLDTVLAGSETHVQEVLCGETICRLDLIHENDLAALDFRPDTILPAADGMSVEAIMDRSEEDERLKHYVYLRAPEALSDEEKKAFVEMERQRAILARGGE